MTARRRELEQLVAFALLVYAWPVLRLMAQIGMWFDYVERLVAGCLVATVVVALAARKLRAGPAAFAVVAVAALPPFVVVGRLSGAWSAVAAGVGWWGVYGRPPWRSWPAPTHAVRLLGVLGLGAGLLGRSHDWVAVAFLSVAVAAVLAGVSRADALAPADALLQRAGGWARDAVAWVGRGFAVAGLWVVAAFAVLLPWAVQRVLRWDPLRWVDATGSRWIRSDDAPPDPDARWSRAPASVRGFRRTAHVGLVSIVVVLATLALLTGALAMVSTSLGGGADAAQEAPSGPPNLAARRLERAPWYNDVSTAVEGMFDRVRMSQFVGAEVPDVRSRYLNVRDGQRRSWRPPVDECRMVTVWMFGGSALFGVGQRDAHTLSSELARTASSEGLALDVRNWGVPGDVSWQELRRLERALLAERREPPDLVVFYDGFNDLYTVSDVGLLPWVKPGQVVGPLDRVHMRAVSELAQTIAKDGTSRDLTVHIDGEPRSDPTRAAPIAARQYAMSHRLAGTLLDSFGVPFVHAVQPMQPRRSSPVAGEAPYFPAEKKMTRDFVAARPPTVVDLSAPFVPADGPVFVDQVHVLEQANVPIARKLLDHLRAPAEAAAATKAAACS